MDIEILKSLFARDLNKLKEEISLYKNEAIIWQTDGNISNAAGNLCLHIVGNLNTYIGAVYAHTGYVRNRPLEFSSKNISRDELIQKIDATILVVEKGLSNITVENLQEDFPVAIWDQPVTTTYTLVHLCTHLSYHLGQVNYHRRLLDV